MKPKQQYNENHKTIILYAKFLQHEWVWVKYVIKIALEIARLESENDVIRQTYFKGNLEAKRQEFQSKINENNYKN